MKRWMHHGTSQSRLIGILQNGFLEAPPEHTYDADLGEEDKLLTSLRGTYFTPSLALAISSADKAAIGDGMVVISCLADLSTAIPDEDLLHLTWHLPEGPISAAEGAEIVIDRVVTAFGRDSAFWRSALGSAPEAVSESWSAYWNADGEDLEVIDGWRKGLDALTIAVSWHLSDADREGISMRFLAEHVPKIDGFAAFEVKLSARRNHASVIVEQHGDIGFPVAEFGSNLAGIALSLPPEARRSFYPVIDRQPSPLLAKLASASKAMADGAGDLVVSCARPRRRRPGAGIG